MFSVGALPGWFEQPLSCLCSSVGDNPSQVIVSVLFFYRRYVFFLPDCVTFIAMFGYEHKRISLDSFYNFLFLYAGMSKTEEM